MRYTLLIILISITLLGYPKVNLGQAPYLGATSSFALFTAGGAFSNSGATIIKGDIGTNVGVLTGFPPGTVIGNIHIADSVSTQAAIDVYAAYAHLEAMACDTTIVAPLGNNQTLIPKIYCTSAITLNASLTLDGQGDSNALFIFKINGALTINAFAQIILVNAASFNNIYWQVNGAVNFGDSSVFKGNVIGNGALNLLQGSSIQGRGLTRAGAIYLNNTQIALPIELLSFNARCYNKHHLLTWSTATETNNDYFLIERCTDGINWRVIGRVAGAGNSLTLKKYSFYDEESAHSINYFRLKQIDFDGKFKYTPCIYSAENCGENSTEFMMYPNPTSGKLSITVSGGSEPAYSVIIYNVLGKQVYCSVDNASIVDLSHLQQGTYFFHFNSSTKKFIAKLMINR